MEVIPIFSGLILLFPDLNPLDLVIWEQGKEQVKTLTYSMGEKVIKFA